MSTEGTKAFMADTDALGHVEETPLRADSQTLGEGLGVFRGLLLTALFYITLGALIWLAWHVHANLRRH